MNSLKGGTRQGCPWNPCLLNIILEVSTKCNEGMKGDLGDINWEWKSITIYAWLDSIQKHPSTVVCAWTYTASQKWLPEGGQIPLRHTSTHGKFSRFAACGALGRLPHTTTGSSWSTVAAARIKNTRTEKPRHKVGLKPTVSELKNQYTNSAVPHLDT